MNNNEFKNKLQIVDGNRHLRFYDREKEYYVYLHYDLNYKIFYVGLGKSYYGRAFSYYSGRSPEWREVVNKNHKKYYVEIVECFNDYEEASIKERELIKQYSDCIVNRVSNGYNAMKGKKQSKEARKKMSEHWSKNPRVGEKNWMYGRTGDKNPNFGNGDKIAGRNNVNSKKVVDLNNGICYYSPSEAAKLTGIKAESIRRSARLKQEFPIKNHHLFSTVNFRYIEEEANI